MNITDEQFDQLLSAIKSISNGGYAPHSEPMGLEALTMAVGGEGKPGNRSVAEGLTDIADALREVAEAIKDASWKPAE